MLDFGFLMTGTVLPSSQSLVMCGAKEGTVMRAVVGLCTLATSFKERSLAHQDSRPFTNCPVELIRFYMKVMVPKERNPGDSLS